VKEGLKEETLSWESMNKTFKRSHGGLGGSQISDQRSPISESKRRMGRKLLFSRSFYLAENKGKSIPGTRRKRWRNLSSGEKKNKRGEEKKNFFFCRGTVI